MVCPLFVFYDGFKRYVWEFVCFNDYFLLYANTFDGEFLAAEVVVA